MASCHFHDSPDYVLLLAEQARTSSNHTLLEPDTSQQAVKSQKEDGSVTETSLALLDESLDFDNHTATAVDCDLTGGSGRDGDGGDGGGGGGGSSRGGGDGGDGGDGGGGGGGSRGGGDGGDGGDGGGGGGGSGGGNDIYRMTFLRLRRVNAIMNFMEKHKIVSGIWPIIKVCA